MKLFRHIITMVCIVACFVAHAGEQPAAKAKGAANQPIAAELQLLQGIWEGVLVGDTAQQKITITITGNSLHFHRETNSWLRRQFHCLQAKTQSSYTPPSKVVYHHRLIASARWSEPSSRLRKGH